MITAQEGALIARFDFRNEDDVRSLLGVGWGRHEQNHRWTVQSQAKMRISLPEAGLGGFILRIQCEAYLAGGRFPAQKVDILVNGLHVARFLAHGMEWHEALIDSFTPLGQDVELTLLISRPTAPAEYRLSDDVRKLGLNVRAIELLRTSSPCLDLESDELEWVGAGADPIGDVFKRRGNFYRAIKRQASSLVQRFVKEGVYETLSGKGLIPEHEFFMVNHAKYSMVAQTRPGTFVYPSNFPLETLKDAAKVWLDINGIVSDIDENYGLIDGHYGNFALFENSKPMWIDIGSIVDVRADFGSLDFGLEQFVRCYIYPLLLLGACEGASSSIRSIMFDQPDGITAEQFSHFGVSDDGLSHFLCSGASLDRRGLLRKLREVVEKINFDKIEGFWSNYRGLGALEDAVSGRLYEDGEDSRFSAVIDLVKRSGATRFLDIGANDGLFSILCSRTGISGIAIDLDDRSINRLYGFLAARRDLKLCVSYGSFGSIPHVAELVLALAITHHLHLSQRLSFGEISETLARSSSRALITEFMPSGLGGTPENPRPHPDPLPSNYTIENFLLSLRLHFRKVEVVDYARPNASSARTLIFCEYPIRLGG